MADESALAPRPAPEVRINDIILPNQTRNENQYDAALSPVPHCGAKLLHEYIVTHCSTVSSY